MRLRGYSSFAIEGISATRRQGGGQSLSGQRQSLPRSSQCRLHHRETASGSEMRRLARGACDFPLTTERFPV